MLNDCNLELRMSDEEFDEIFDELQNRLMVLQQKIYHAKIPVIMIFEGWSCSGKGTVIAKLIDAMDPRNFKVHAIDKPNCEEKACAPMQRFWRLTPNRGRFAIFDRSWYQVLGIDSAEDKLSLEDLSLKYREITAFEQMLTADGCIILKFFLHISKKEQKKRFKTLEAHKLNLWKVTDDDWRLNEDYNKYYDRFNLMLGATSTGYAPWHIVPAMDENYAVNTVYNIVIDTLEKALDENYQNPALLNPLPTIPAVAAPTLAEINLNEKLDPEDYHDELRDCRKKLAQLQDKLYAKKRPLIVAFEGCDAAGKGGSIKRLCRSFDPRGYDIIPTPSPTPEELSHQYLWRFWRNVPPNDRIAIFDRTWYGRVMVERIEGFCTENEWQRAYQEINHFEKSLCEWGAILVKFWLQIDPDEQLKRFNARQENPDKRWKITDEDWRNREKWNEYQQAVDEMVLKTNTEYAPWTIVPANDKKYARIRVMKEVIRSIENEI